MPVKVTIRENHYADSVVLMRVAADLETLAGVRQATAIMATAANIELAAAAGLIEATFEARPNDLMIAVLADTEQNADAALAAADERLDNTGAAATAEAVDILPKSIDMVLDQHPDLNLALISCPGEYAAAEARKALNLGLHVMLFSDNVSIDDEIGLKATAVANDLMMMGPDCGSAIVNGVPLGFANVVAPGPVGIVAASGTGLQQVSCLLSQWGIGISQAIGTGGRDLSAAVGGVTMLQGLKALAEDPNTDLVVLVSKPPGEAVAAALVAAAAAIGKPVVICFLGAERQRTGPSVHFVQTLEEAAIVARAIVENAGAAIVDREPAANTNTGVAEAGEAQAGFVRGVYSGGTFCYEAQLILAPMLGPIWSSTPVEANHTLADPRKSQEHTIVDLGDDTFTRGRPHPMIDHRTRHERILQEAADPETAVILFDVVLGYGAHPDPASEIAISVGAAREIAQSAGREIAFVGFVCGTDNDPQNRARQIETLQSAGVILEDSNAAAARRAATLALSGGGRALRPNAGDGR